MATPRKPCRDCWGEHLDALEAWDNWSPKWVDRPKPVFRNRPAPYVGPRCFSHHKIEQKRRNGETHARLVERKYGLERGDYALLVAFQQGTCAIPRCPARGVARRLAVDHNHKTGEPRGLLCSKHNRLIGESFDDPTVFEAIAEYLRNPPYKRMKDGLSHEGTEGI